MGSLLVTDMTNISFQSRAYESSPKSSGSTDELATHWSISKSALVVLACVALVYCALIVIAAYL